MRSSYIKNNYGSIFEKTVEIFLPHKCVELGVLDGYSLLHIARGAQLAKIHSKHPVIVNAYDIWDDYQYKHGSMFEVQEMLENNGVSEPVTLHRKDAFEVYKDYEDHSVCFLHVDLSNTGNVLQKIVEQWDDKLSFGGLLLFEGGSEERDNIDWMKKYQKKPIRPEIVSNVTLNKKYIYGTYDAFPSLSIFRKYA